jgi:hypothetical protein
MQIPKSKQNSYSENGFLIVKNLLKKSSIKKIQKTILNRSKFYTKNSKNYKSFYDKEFHLNLIKLKKEEPKKFGSFYDSIQKSLQLYSIILEKKLTNYVSGLAKLSHENISFNGENIRMDLPKNKLHNLDWHQDRSYYFQNRDGNKGIVCWIPLINLKKEIGPLRVCVSSHKDGFIKNYKKYRKNKKHSFQRSIELKKKYKIVSKPLNEGDVIFMNKNTIHASGTNKSDYIRFSLQVRVHDLMDPNYLSFRHIIVYNKDDINFMRKQGLDLNDIEKIAI